MARVKRRPGIGRVTRYCVPVAAASGPTVILNAAYATDTLLDQGLVPITEGGELDSWAMATGGTFNYETAFLAGASARPIYVAASGVHTAGINAALTCATPVTIPALATADWDIWVYCVLPAVGTLIALGTTAVANWPTLALETGLGPTIVDNNGDGASDESAGLPSGACLVRIANTSGTLSAAWTGEADHAMTNEGYSASLAPDTILAMIGAANYSTTGAYLKALRAVSYPPGYADRASYRSTYETAISGAALT